MASLTQKTALLVLLENVGHIHGLNLPHWMRAVIDFISEAYAKFILRLYGAHRRYDKVIILEDAEANGMLLASTLLNLSEAYEVDVFLLVHGLKEGLVGFRGKPIKGETFGPLLDRAKEHLLNLRVVYGLNCYGSSLAETWQALGAKAVCGANGVNWFPEPGLSGFLLAWLRGRSFTQSVAQSNRATLWVGRRLLGEEHVGVKSSTLHVFGEGANVKAPKTTNARSA